MKKILMLLSTMSLMFTLCACNVQDIIEESPSVTFNFEKDIQGWNGGFADLPVDYDKNFYELEFKQTTIPVQNNKDKGILLKGNNHSDDLFMYITKKFDKKYGLQPNTTYKVNIAFDMATNVPGGMMGVGGSPGSSVYVKAGATNVEPKAEKYTDGYYRMNIDKANQSQSGKDMVVIGDLEKVDSEDDSFQYKHFETTFQVNTNEKGEGWTIIGVDSGFESLSEIYFTNIRLTLTR